MVILKINIQFYKYNFTRGAYYMKEVAFLQKNTPKWKQFESLLHIQNQLTQTCLLIYLFK